MGGGEAAGILQLTVSTVVENKVTKTVSTKPTVENNMQQQDN